MKNLIYVLIAALLMFGCAEEEEPSKPVAVTGPAPVASEFVGMNNIASIEGERIGLGTVENSELYRSVSIVLKTPSDYFAVGPAIISKPSVESNLSVKLIIKVRNKTENLAFCNIATTGIATNDGMWQWIISTISNNKVLGSLGIEDSKFTSSCLGAEKYGYILQSVSAVDDSILTLYEDISQIEIDEIVYSSASVIDPNISIIPQGYDMSDDTMSVTVKNTGQDYAYVWPGRSYAVLLDYDSTVIESTTDATTDTSDYVIIDQTTDVVTEVYTDPSTDVTSDVTSDVTTYTIERPIYAPGTPIYYFKLGSSLSIPYQLRPGEDATMDVGSIEYNGSSYKATIFLGLGTDAWSSAYSIAGEE